MNGRMQVLVDGEWQDVGGTLSSFTLDEDTAGDDEQEQIPTSFEMSVPISPAAGAALWEAIERAERVAQAQRALRRLWLRFPYRGEGVR